MNTYPFRIKEIVSMLDHCRLLADIGCDHAYVCILAVRTNKADHAIACDINKGPLARAEDNIVACGLRDKIDICLSDGLNDVPESADAITICGMGGLLIRNILRVSQKKAEFANQLLLGPHSEIPELRKYIEEDTSFTICREKVIIDQKKYYVLMDLRKKCGPKEPWTKEQYISGKKSIQCDMSLYRKYLEHMIHRYNAAIQKICCDTESAAQRKIELTEIVNILRNAYETI